MGRPDGFKNVSLLTKYIVSTYLFLLVVSSHNYHSLNSLLIHQNHNYVI